jgi:hypothetical protein
MTMRANNGIMILMKFSFNSEDPGDEQLKADRSKSVGLVAIRLIEF